MNTFILVFYIVVLCLILFNTNYLPPGFSPGGRLWNDACVCVRACVRGCVRALVSHADSSKTTTATDFL